MNKKPNLENLKPFKNGKDARRNIKGQPKKLPALDVIIAEVLGQETGGLTAAQRILNALKLKAQRGDVRAAELLMDRAYGKARQSIVLSGNPDAPINFVLDERYKDNSGIPA